MIHLTALPLRVRGQVCLLRSVAPFQLLSDDDHSSHRLLVLCTVGTSFNFFTSEIENVHLTQQIQNRRLCRQMACSGCPS